MVEREFVTGKPITTLIEILSINLKPGTREAIRALIESYVDVVLEMDEVTVQGLRK